MEQQDTSILKGKIKAQIIRPIFKNVCSKYLKNVEYFYIICSMDQLEMRFMTRPQDILLTITLKRDNFVSYSYKQEKPTLRKYNLLEFVAIPIMFENNKHTLDLSIDNEFFTLTYHSQSGGFTTFRQNNLNCDQDDEEQLSRIDKQRQVEDNQNCLELTFQEVSMFDGILRYSKSMKLPSLWIKFNSVERSLEVADKSEKPTIRWLLKVKKTGKVNLNFHHQIPFSSFGCALNLLPNHSQLRLTIYSGCMVFKSESNEEKTLFDIKISALSEKE